MHRAPLPSGKVFSRSFVPSSRPLRRSSSAATSTACLMRGTECADQQPPEPTRAPTRFATPCVISTSWTSPRCWTVFHHASPDVKGPPRPDWIECTSRANSAMESNLTTRKLYLSLTTASSPPCSDPEGPGPRGHDETPRGK
ncbi:unnamed protein product [Ixodes persulcatus]